MFHAVRHHWRAFVTDDPAVTMFIGPSMVGEPLEVGVDEMSTTRAARTRALETWADAVEPEDLVVADTQSLRAIAELAERRGEVDAALVEAIRSARRADRSWSEIGAMLGVSKQAAQRKYSKLAV